MKNFLRALRCAWPYRGRLILSIVCALIAAIFWGLTLAAIYPVLQGLGRGVSLHVWVQTKIDDTKEDIRGVQRAVDHVNDQIKQIRKGDDQEQRKLTADKARLEGKMAAASRKLNLYVIASE